MQQSVEYQKYIRSDAWAKKKAERLEIDNFKCALCGRPASKCKNGIQCHHVSYKNLGNENVYTDIVSVCGRCHKMLHAYYNRRQSP